jgi:hypothetical protein
LRGFGGGGDGRPYGVAFVNGNVVEGVVLGAGAAGGGVTGEAIGGGVGGGVAAAAARRAPGDEIISPAAAATPAEAAKSTRGFTSAGFLECRKGLLLTPLI